MDETGTRNLQWSTCLIQMLVESGVDRFIISPGSRSTPLALAAARNQTAEHWVIIDERDAAFFALGQSRKRGTPSALICTSGSAVANWLPAVVEANHSATPLLLLSADRPPELHNCGANQTIEQHNLFGEQVRGSYTTPPPDEIEEPLQRLSTLVPQLIQRMSHPLPGPVHLNIPLRKPLLSEDSTSIDCQSHHSLPAQVEGSEAGQPIDKTDYQALARTIHGEPGLILCGEGSYDESFYPLLEKLAERLDSPIIADPLSNLRWGHPENRRLITHYDGLLRGRGAANLTHPEWIIQFGRFPLSSSLENFLQQRPPPRYITVHHKTLWSDPLSLSTQKLEIDPSSFCTGLLGHCGNNASLPEYNHTLQQQEKRAAEWSSSESALNEHQIIQTLRQQLPDGALLFSGNSMAIRDLDGWLASREQPLQLFANRGASGIDGNLATVCGIRSTTGSDTPVVALLGDLTLFHNLNALYLAKESGMNLTILLLNNGGGNIFSYLPPAELDEFESLWLTPTTIDFKKAAQLYDIPYRSIDQQNELQQLGDAFRQGGPKLIELVVDRNSSNHIHQQYWESLH